MRRSPSTVILLGVCTFALWACGHEDSDGDKGPVDGYIEGQPPADIGQLTQAFAIHPNGIIGTNGTVILSAWYEYLQDPTITCPAVEDRSEGTTTDVTFTGGCTNDMGTPADVTDDLSWEGVATFYQDQTMLELSSTGGFSIVQYQDCDQMDNTRTITSIGTESLVTDEIGVTWSGSYRIDITGPYGVNCEPLTQTVAVSMGGTIDGVFMSSVDTEVVYNTSGQLAVSNYGRWTLETADMVHMTDDLTTDGTDSYCAEPISGAFVLKSGGDVAELHPDGATDCTQDACMAYSFNGEAMPDPICGIYGY